MILIASSAAALVSALAPFAVRPILRRSNVVDVPNERSSHSKPTLRGGGLSVLLGCACGMFVGLAGAAGELDLISTLTIAGSSALAAGVGFVEDIRGLPIASRAAAQTIVAFVASLTLAVAFGAPWWAVGSATLLIAGYINTANFMDGINAISAFQGLVGGVAFLLIGAIAQMEWLQLVGAVVAAAFALFLPWNLTPPGMFLGDVGSYLLGAAIATTAVATWYSGVGIVTAVSPLVIYIADTGATLLRRVARGEKWYEAHRTHTYQQLTDAGMTHMAVAAIVAAFTMACSAIGLLLLAVPASAGWNLIAVVALALVTGAYLAMPRVVARARVEV